MTMNSVLVAYRMLQPGTEYRDPGEGPPLCGRLSDSSICVDVSVACMTWGEQRTRVGKL
jgi:hypothetical protein